ncbi:hypothetical protein Ait01nite_073720 [Actinoplanes italicus]|uniref:GAF domain-containing protein n=1 Tax=Actinoplanes italicus TaxID=113567 RepID=A0A2T0K0Y8_9ACTN|nr:GAF domain-containing protein [Actinoplanes italicus]PRX16252.1 GAF domain-containing protein [Actinoplanes italicus]GIE34327.1 hypothetical protein Ait01nite_073720 [Actinoplanes italicus]
MSASARGYGEDERAARARELVEAARRRRADAELRLRAARRDRAGAAEARAAAEEWRRQVRAELEERWLQLERRATDLARYAVLGSSDRRGLVLFEPEFGHVRDPGAIGSAVLSAALTLSRAAMGNVQLVDPVAGGLRMVAQIGFDAEFTEFFALVRERGTACGAALAEGRTVQVHDVERSGLFTAGAARDTVLSAGVRSVRSIPLTGPDGVTAGILSVHYPRPHEPDAAERRLLDLLATAGARRLRGLDKQQGLDRQPGPDKGTG